MSEGSDEVMVDLAPLPHHRGLSQRQVVEAALATAAAEGFTGISMRAVAEGLSVSPMAIYHHVPNKQALLVLVADEVLGSIPLPDEHGSWQERILDLSDSAASTMRAYPGMAEFLIDIGLTPMGRRLMNGYLQILLDAGFDERQALLAYNILHTYGIGRTVIESRVRRRAAGDRERHESPPALRRVQPFVVEVSGSDYRTFAHEVILRGLEPVLEDE